MQTYYIFLETLWTKDVSLNKMAVAELVKNSSSLQSSNVDYADYRAQDSHWTLSSHKRQSKDLSTRGVVLNYEIVAVFTTVTMKNAGFWDVTPCGSYKNRRLEGKVSPLSSK
jgi:hypothetical protein